MAEYSDIYYKLVHELPDKRISEELIEWFKGSNEVNIFITGKTGVGKSTLINSLLGEKKAAQGGHLIPGTSVVTDYDFVRRSIHVKVWDSPGLQDGTPNEARYLADMKEKCSNMDICIYCINLTQTRFVKGCDDIVTMKKLTEVFGKRMWENAMFVLTFANAAEQMDANILDAAEKEEKVRLFKEKIQQWKGILTGVLVEEIRLRKTMVDRIQVVPAGHASKPALLDRDHWLSTFWFATLYAMHPRAQPAMVKLNYHRIVENPGEIHDEDRMNFLQKQPLIFSKRGASIGSKYGMSGSGKTIGSSMGTSVQLALEIHFSSTEFAKEHDQGLMEIVRHLKK